MRGLLTMVKMPPTTGSQSHPSDESRQLTYSHPGEVGESSGLHMSPQSLSCLAPFSSSLTKVPRYLTPPVR